MEKPLQKGAKKQFKKRMGADEAPTHHSSTNEDAPRFNSVRIILAFLGKFSNTGTFGQYLSHEDTRVPGSFSASSTSRDTQISRFAIFIPKSAPDNLDAQSLNFD